MTKKPIKAKSGPPISLEELIAIFSRAEASGGKLKTSRNLRPKRKKGGNNK